MERRDEAQERVEIEVLKKMGLRWAVLASWRMDLHARDIRVDQGGCRLLESTRIKIASGCFSSCEVGCDLGHIEGCLTSADASSPTPAVDHWLDLLGRSMADTVDAQMLLSIPAVKFHYSECALRGCRCDT